MGTNYPAASPADFPEPHRFGIWNGFSFAIYSNLSQVKSAITSKLTDYDGSVRREVRVYEHDGTRWQEIYYLPQGSAKNDCPLWHGVAPKTLAVSDEAVEAAIQSILGTKEA